MGRPPTIQDEAIQLLPPSDFRYVNIGIPSCPVPMPDLC